MGDFNLPDGMTTDAIPGYNKPKTSDETTDAVADDAAFKAFWAAYENEFDWDEDLRVAFVAHAAWRAGQQSHLLRIEALEAKLAAVRAVPKYDPDGHDCAYCTGYRDGVEAVQAVLDAEPSSEASER